MELELSALTRRDRLERIAAAERDRRAGRSDLAAATLGEAAEWPARIVLALIGLPDGEGFATREMLMSTLDTWAAETGLSSLDMDFAVVAVEVPVPRVRAESIESEVSLGTNAPVANALDAPIEMDELERAFAEAEAQTDEMHDANTVAERVLMDEPFGLAELSGDAIDSIDDGLSEVDADYDPASSHAGSAWPAIPPSYPRSSSHSPGDEVEEMDAASVAYDDMSITEAAASDESPEVANEMPTRGVVLATFERWITNLENNKAGRA